MPPTVRPRRGAGSTRPDATRRIAPDAEHALHMPSHIFLQLGHVGRHRRLQRARLGGLAGRSGREEALERRFELPCAAVAAVRLPAAGTRIAITRADRDSARACCRASISPAASTSTRDSPSAGWSSCMPPTPATGRGSVCESAGKPVEPLQRHDLARTFVPCGCVVSAGHRDADVRARKRGARVHPLPVVHRDGRACERSLKTALVPRPLIGYLRGDVTVDVAAVNAGDAAPDQPLVGPPLTLRTNELLGEVHLKAGRPRDAVADYERALETTPNRAAALLGLARARAAAGDRPARQRPTSSCWRTGTRPTRIWPALTEARGGS